MSSRPRTRAARVGPAGLDGCASRPSRACPRGPVAATDCQPRRVHARHGPWRATLVTAVRTAIRQVPLWPDGPRTGVLNYRSPRDWIKPWEGTGAGCGDGCRSLPGGEIGASARGGAVLSCGDVELARDIGRIGMSGYGERASGMKEVNALGRADSRAYAHVHLPAHRILSHRVPHRPLLLVDGRCRRCRHRRLNAWAACVFDWSRVGVCWPPALAGKPADGGQGGGNAHAA